MTRLPQQSSRLVGRFSPPTNRLAYTLLELVIVMSILASVAAVVWPRVSPLLRRSVHRDAALQVKADLAEARERARASVGERESRSHSSGGAYGRSAAVEMAGKLPSTCAEVACEMRV